MPEKKAEKKRLIKIMAKLVVFNFTERF